MSIKWTRTEAAGATVSTTLGFACDGTSAAVGARADSVAADETEGVAWGGVEVGHGDGVAEGGGADGVRVWVVVGNALACGTACGVLEPQAANETATIRRNTSGYGRCCPVSYTHLTLPTNREV